ncbi:MAG: hypothetical protein JRI65_10135 [Deltaproteobacteria bacterium]|nr:hypothetical protein [Deltaproteobacteria bacterium]
MFETIKDYFFKNREKYNLRVTSRTDISVVSYAVNSDEYGVVNIFLSDKNGPRFILKISRYDRFGNLYRKRLRSLSSELQDDVYAKVRTHILASEEINIAGKDYLLFPYINCVNAYMKIRRAILGRDKIMADIVDAVLTFSFKLEEAGNAWAQKISEKLVETIIRRFIDSYNSDEVNSLNNKIQNVLKNGQIDICQTITHNDLCATNVLVGHGTYWVADWEYWDNSAGIFNFFDILLDFGSLIGLGIFQKRSYANFLHSFSTDGRNSFISKCRHYGEKVGYSALDPEAAWYLFLLYLMNKATCQYRVYRSHYNFDYFWYRILLNSLAYKDVFIHWWQRCML